METFSALLAISAGNSLVTGEFPSQRPVIRSFDVSLFCALNKRRSKNREAGDLRRHRAHYDVIVMRFYSWNLDLTKRSERKGTNHLHKNGHFQIEIFIFISWPTSVYIITRNPLLTHWWNYCMFALSHIYAYIRRQYDETAINVRAWMNIPHFYMHVITMP